MNVIPKSTSNSSVKALNSWVVEAAQEDGLPETHHGTCQEQKTG